MTNRTRSRLSWAIVTGSAVYVIAAHGQPSWRDVVVGLAVVVAVIASRYRPVQVVTSEDVFARLVHPSAWSCDGDDWPEPEEGIEL
jgi:hypothetical protein